MEKQINIKYDDNTTLGKNFEVLRRNAKAEGLSLTKKVLLVVSESLKREKWEGI